MFYHSECSDIMDVGTRGGFRDHLEVDEGEVYEDEEATPRDRSVCTVPELKSHIQKIKIKLQLILDVNTSEKCTHDSCPCDNELSFPSYTSFVSHTDCFSLEAKASARSILESSLLFHLAVLGGKMSPERSRFATKSSELSSFSSDIQKISCNRTSPDFSTSKGMLCCLWKDEQPYFLFSSKDDCGEVYVANRVKVESSVDKALDYVYMFRSRVNRRRKSRRHCHNASDIVGRMKVSSSLVLTNCNRTRMTETEFVLFGSHEDHSKEMQISSLSFTKGKGLSKKVHKFKQNSIREVKDEFMRETSIGESRDPSEVNQEDFPPNLELVTIIVKDYEHNRNKEASVDGWGLKFLDKENCRGSCKSNCQPFAQEMDVLVPTGFHGCPKQRSGKPSTLTEKWRSGGRCDCGGWDLGCPLTVLKGNSNCSKPSFKKTLELDSDFFCLSVEGKQIAEPTLRMLKKNEGAYHVYFRPTLSALQSFSIAVAVIHAQFPDLSRKL